VVELHPATVDAYRKMVADLRAGLAASNDEVRSEAQEVLRSLIETIQVHPGERRGETNITIRGRIAELINLPRLEPRQAARTVLMAEGGGFEPPIRLITV
jgi:site-specific DNA recombinase